MKQFDMLKLGDECWDVDEICIGQRNQTYQATISEKVYLGGKLRCKGELIEFKIKKVPDNKYQTQDIGGVILDRDDRFTGMVERIYPWSVENCKLL